MMTSIALRVDDLDRAVPRLKEQNVNFVMDICQRAFCRRAAIPDPDGNKAVIHKGNS